MDPDILSLGREAARARNMPPNARCEVCAAERHLISRADGTPVCYECAVVARGGSGVERDHVAGRANLGGLLVDLQANDHRTVTELRLAVGVDRWPTASGDPLLALAHVLAGIASLLVLLADWLVRDDAAIAAGAGRPRFPVVA